MALREITIGGYRSVRGLRLPLGRVNILAGPNGCGKSNIYRAVYLLTRAVEGAFARTLAQEGGMPSALWAGTRKNGAVRLTVAVTVDDWEYRLACGLPKPDDREPTMPRQRGFDMDPFVKEEIVAYAPKRGRRVVFMERDHLAATLRDTQGARTLYPLPLVESESALSQIIDPYRYPELSALVQTIRAWRFYHLFRTDLDTPVRQAHPATRTPVLSTDGHDLAAALLTIRKVGDNVALEQAVDRAFPGARLELDVDEHYRIHLMMRVPGVLRPLEACELSDGTLRYLCLLAALLSPRPPELMALNEPETSLHPDLLEPLGRLIADTGKRCQIWVTTHSPALANAVAEHAAVKPVELEMVNGETRVVGQGLLDTPRL